MAQRELGIFYMTHPDVTPRALAPFTKPSTVFRADMIAQGDYEKQRKGDLSEDKRKAVVDERRVGKEEVGKSVFADAADGTNDQVQCGRDTTPTFVAR